MSRRVVDILCDPLAFLQQSHLREIVVSLLQLRLALIQRLQCLAEAHVLPIKPNGQIDEHEMDHKDQKVVEALGQERQHGNAFAV